MRRGILVGKGGNDECRMTNDERMTKSEARRGRGPVSSFVIGASPFFRHSSFDIRHWTVAALLALLPALPARAADDTLRVVCLGDSVTKAVRPGVKPDETYCVYLEKALNAAGVKAKVTNA